MIVILDTHTLIWWVNADKSLSKKAHKKIQETLKKNGEVIISSISAWEIATLIQKKRLNISMDLDSWFDEVSRIEGVRFTPIDNEVGIKSTTLPGDFHKDPADRMIVATARKFSAPLITADEKILNYPHVKSLW